MLTMVPVVYGIKELATHGPGVQSLGVLAFGLAMGLVFVRRQQALASPLLDLSLFRNRVFSTAITANVLALFSYNGFILFLAQHLQLLEGMSPSESGTAMLPALTAIVVAGLLVVPLVRKIRPGFVVAAGLALSAAGYALVAFGDHDAGPTALLAALLILALGVGSAETISNDLILGAVPAGKIRGGRGDLGDGLRSGLTPGDGHPGIDPDRVIPAAPLAARACCPNHPGGIRGPGQGNAGRRHGAGRIAAGPGGRGPHGGRPGSV